MKLKLTSLRPGLTTSLFGLWLAGSAAAQTTSFGTPCPGGSGQDPAIELSGFPYVGLPISAIIRGPAAAPGLLIGGTSTLLPLDLTFLGLTNCSQVVPLEFLLGNFTLDASGNAQMAFTAPPNGAGLTVNLQALVIDPGSGPFGSTLGGVTGGLGITFQPLPAGNTPIVSNFGPLTAEPGGLITLQGANLGTDLGALSVFIDSPEPTYLLPVSLSGNSLTVRLAPYSSEDAVAGPLTIARGMGGQVQLGPIGGAVFSTPAVGHCWNDADPANSSQTLAAFSPKVDPLPLTTACAAVVADTNGVGWKMLTGWSLNNGVLELQVPQSLCPSDQLYLQVKFARCPFLDTDYGGGAIVTLPNFVVNPCSSNSLALVTGVLVAELVTAFDTAGVPVDVTSQTIGGVSKVMLKAKPSFGTICGTPKGGLMVKYGPSTLNTVVAGINDNAAQPTEPATPSALLSAFLQTTYGVTTTKGFDDSSDNRWLAHSFTTLPANIRAAALEFRATASTGASNDAVNLFVESPQGTVVFAWGAQFATLPESGGSWSGNSAAFCLNLSALPTPSGPVNILPLLCNGRLHFTVQDDTMVDYAELAMRTCN